MNYFGDLKNFKKYTNKIMLEKILNEIEDIKETIEKKYSAEIYKNNKRYYLHSYKKRIIRTCCGKIKIIRGYFKDCKTGKYIFPLDKKLDLIRKKLYDRKIIEEVEILLKQRNNLISISKILSIPISSLHNIVRTLEIGRDEIKIKLNKSNNLFVNVDDTYIKLRKNKIVEKMKIRLIAIHQGKDQKNKLINLKTFVFFPDLINDNQPNFIKAIINNNYFGKPKKIILCSDGAKEFKFISAKNGFLQCLDKWHVLHKLNAVLVPKMKNSYGLDVKTRSSLRKKIKNLIKKTNIKKAISILSNLKWKTKNINLIALIDSYIKYLKRNYDAIKIWLKENISTTTEGFIFHKIKSLLGNKNKCFSFDIFKKIVGLQTNYLE